MMLLALAVTLGLATAASSAYVSNDGGQYLSTIAELLAGHGLRTSTVYYEVQAQFGMPAVQTVWPPGLPLLAAGVSQITGLGDVRAVAILNAAAHGATAVLLYRLCKRLLKGDSVTALLIGVCYLGYAVALMYTLAVLAEPLFTLCLVAAAACLMRAYDEAEDGARLRWLLATSICVGLSCLFRYLGLAFILMLGLIALWDLVRSRVSRLALLSALALVAPASLMLGAQLVRNLLLTGRLTGGPSAARGLEFHEILVQSKWAVIGLLGGGQFWYGKLALLVFLASFGGWLGTKLVRTHWQGLAVPEGPLRLAAFTLGGSVLSVAIVLWLALNKTGIAIEGRYFAPSVPMLIIGLAALWPSLGTAGARSAGQLGYRAAAASAVLLTLVNLLPFATWLQNGGTPARLAEILSEPVEGKPALSLLQSAATLESPVMSNQSQALHVVLRRPTLGVPERRLTPTEWTPEAIVEVARKFGVTYLAVFRTMPLGSADGRDDYVWRAGQATTAGLDVVHQSEELAIFRIAPGHAAADTASRTPAMRD